MFNLNAFSIFKKPDAPPPDAPPAGFLNSMKPSKLLDSVTMRKNGLLDDLSNRFDLITKLVSKDDASSAARVQPKRRPRPAKPRRHSDDSSASEYGDDGDKPVYVDQPQTAQPRTYGSTESLDEFGRQIEAKMIDFVAHVVESRYDISAAEKKLFFELAKDSVGQQVFCKELQRSGQSRVTESVFQRLVECFAYVLKESHESEDYLSARMLMNICFTIYHEDEQKRKVYLYEAVRSQPIWQSLRFWNAAFYDALRYERAKRSKKQNSDEAPDAERDREEQEMITFNLLSSFTSSMRTFGISKDICLDFIKKQSLEAVVGSEKVRILRNNMINWTDKK